MSGKTMIVVASMVIAGFVAVANFIYERQRYATNNLNATGDDFHVYQDEDHCTCPVCLDPMNVENESSCAILHCGHIIHRSCLRGMNDSRAFLQRTNVCPICRTPIRFT